MIVEAWGGPHDGRSIEVPDGTTEIRFVVAPTIDWRELVASGELPPPPLVDLVYPIEIRNPGLDAMSYRRPARAVVVNPPGWPGR